MNDPHVVALHYWVEHDESVDYEDARPLQCENELFHVHADKKQVTIRPKDHYASEEEAREVVEVFIRNWEFHAALDLGGGAFSLAYGGADVYDRDPTPSPSGTVRLSGNLRAGPAMGRARLSVGRTSYPSPPSGPLLNADAPFVQSMLSRLERFYRGREPLATMAYFCLTTLEESAPKSQGATSKDKQIRDHYSISRRVLKEVARLSSEKGGPEARKGGGLGNEYTEEEKRFLIAAVKAFILRAAEKESDPRQCLPEITAADLPSVP